VATGNDIKAGKAYVELYANKAPIRSDLAATKAEVERWQAEVNRITSNAQKAARAGDLTSAGRQSMQLPQVKAQLEQAQRAYAERAVTASQEAAGRAALNQRLATYKSLTAEARAQQQALPISQLAAANQQIRQQAAGAKQTTSQFERLGTAALKVGIAVESAKAGLVVLGLVTAAVKGDWEKVDEFAFRLPFGLGEICQLTAAIMDYWTGAADEAERLNKAVERQRAYQSGMERLQSIIRSSNLSAKSATGDQRAVLEDQRKALLDEIKHTQGSQLKKQAAVDAVNAEYQAKLMAPIQRIIKDRAYQAATAGMTDSERTIFDLKNLGAGADELERAAKALKDIESAELAGNLEKAIKAASGKASAIGQSPIETALKAFEGADPAQIDKLRQALENLQKVEAKQSFEKQVSGLMQRISLATGKTTGVDAAVADFQRANPGATEMQINTLRETMKRADLAEWAKGKVDALPKDFAAETAELKKKLQASVGEELMTKAKANAIWTANFDLGTSLRGTTAGTAAAIQSLQTGPSLDPLVKAAQGTEKNTKELVDQGGPLYAP